MFRHLIARLSALSRGPARHDASRKPTASKGPPPGKDDSGPAEPSAGEPGVQPQWAIVANVVDERPFGPGGEETKRGLKIFRPNAKVYVIDGFGGMGWETVTVVGQPRKSPRWVTAHVQARNLHNFRVKLVYTPAALRRITQLRWPTPDDPNRRFGGFWLGLVDDCGNAAYRDSLQEVIRRTLPGKE